MRGQFLFLFLFCVSIFFVSADTKSSTKTEFNIAGCTNGQPINTCSVDGRVYCGADLKLYNTMLEGCEMGKNPFVSGVDNQCCPDNHICLDGKCVLIGCSAYTSQSDCESNNCIWFKDGEEESCRDDLNGFGCGVYKNANACESDIYNLGQEGEGTEVCGTYVGNSAMNTYVIPFETCHCKWDGNCKLSYSVISEFFGSIADSFECMKLFNSGECVDGLRSVSWTAGTTDKTGKFVSGISPEVLNAAECVDGSLTADCGKPLLKLPAFSFLGFIISVALIFAIYYFSKSKALSNN